LFRRALLTVPTLLGLSILVFLSVRILPGGPEAAFCATGCTAADAEQVRRALGLDRPLLLQYVDWAAGVLSGDLGRSFHSGIPVSREVGRRLPVTAELGLLSILFSVGIGLPVGVVAAANRGRWLDHAARTLAVALMCAPVFWVATLVIAYGGAWLNWAPPLEYRPPWEAPFQHLGTMVIPAIILGGAPMGAITRLTRTQMLEALQQDYVRVARAKGLSDSTVVSRHALRNALLPLVTYVGVQMPVILGGSVLVESIFQIPGMGQYVVGAIGLRDFPIIQGANLVIAVGVVGANLIIDASYTWLDPRLRTGVPWQGR
jgi:peptide/nickel transport system permease protein